MRPSKIPPVDSQVVQLRRRPVRSRRRRHAPAVESPGRTRGRAWINGREVGGTDPRFVHLAEGYD